MSLVLLIASGLASAIAVLAWWHRDRVKDGHHPEVLSAIRLNAVCALVVVVFAGVNQYQSSKQATVMREAQLGLTVLQKLSVYQVDMLDSYWALVRHSAVNSSYSQWEQVRTTSASTSVAIPTWESRASASAKDELQQSRTAFDRLQKISREILISSENYPHMIPETLVSWANATLELKFTDAARVANAYHITEESKRYADLLGRSFGVITGEIKALTVKLTQ